MKIIKSIPSGVALHWSKDDENVLHGSNKLHLPLVTSIDFGVYKIEIKRGEKLILTIYRHLFRNGNTLFNTMYLIMPVIDIFIYSSFSSRVCNKHATITYISN